VDERCVAVGVRVLAATALTTLWDGRLDAAADAPLGGAAEGAALS
jgi:amidohydrolase